VNLQVLVPGHTGWAGGQQRNNISTVCSGVARSSNREDWRIFAVSLVEIRLQCLFSVREPTMPEPHDDAGKDRNLVNETL